MKGFSDQTMVCRRNGGVCLWERSTLYSKGSRGASRSYSTHLSEGMPSVLLLCLLCMAYHSSQHGPALEMQFKSTTGYLREAGAWCLYLQIFSSELMYYFTCDGASTWQCKRLYLNIFSKSPSHLVIFGLRFAIEMLLYQTLRMFCSKTSCMTSGSTNIHQSASFFQQHATSVLEICFACGGCHISLD